MKRRRLGIVAFLAAFALVPHPCDAVDVVFSETFGVLDDGPAPGVNCDPDFPVGWTRYNLDGRTPNSQVAYVNNAWIVRDNEFFSQPTNCVAYSTSYYEPAGQSDDWMVTPQIAVPVIGAKMTFSAVTTDPSWRDGYEVRWATTNAVASFLANPPLLTVEAENTYWTHREIDLSALAGQSVYFAFRNNSNDKFLLIMDNVRVISVPDYDAVIVSVSRPNASLTRIPVPQGFPLQLGGTILNDGTQPLTNLVLTAHVKLDGAVVHTVASSPTASLAPGANANVTISPYAVGNTGILTVEYTLSLAEPDEIPSNNTMVSPALLMTNGELARDDGVVVNYLGIGVDGGGGQLGHQFQLLQPATVKAIRYYATATRPDLSGDAIIGEIRSMTTKPATLLAQTDPYIVPTPPVAGFVDLNFATPVALPAGHYYFGLVEPVHDPDQDDALDLGQAATIFTYGTTWVNFPAIPSGDWTNVETFHSQNAKALMLRVLFDNTADLSVTKSASPSPALVGASLTYTITVSNAGPDIAGDVVVTDPLPAGVTFVSATGSGWTCSYGKATVTCTRVSIPVGSAPPISIVVTTQNVPGDLVNTVTVTTSSQDLDSPTTAYVVTSVLPPFGTPANFAAIPVVAEEVGLSWQGVFGATSYEIHRTTSINVPFTFLSSTSVTGTSDLSVAPNTTYLYKVRALGDSQTSAFSPIDAATTTTFTTPLVTVNHADVTELRTAVNAMRLAAALPAETFTDDPLLAGMTIKAVHLTQLRTALNAARSGIGLPAIPYTDPTIVPGVTVIKRDHLQQLRIGVE